MTADEANKESISFLNMPLSWWIEQDDDFKKVLLDIKKATSAGRFGLCFSHYKTFNGIRLCNRNY